MQYTIFLARSDSEQVPSSRKQSFYRCCVSVHPFYTMLDQRKSKAVQSSWGKKRLGSPVVLTPLLKVVRESRGRHQMQTKQQHGFRGLSQQKNAKLSKISEKFGSGFKIKVRGSHRKKGREMTFSVFVHPCRET